MRLYAEHELNGATSRLWQADVVQLLQYLEASSVDLIVTSPPYFIGKEYDTSKSADDFKLEIRRVLEHMVHCLKPGGSLCWQIGNHVRDGVLLPLDALIVHELHGHPLLTLRNRIIWTFDHGAHSTYRFSGRHETILWYTKGKEAYFDLDSVRVPQKYPGKKHYKGPRKGQWSGNPLGKNPGDVWDIGELWSIPNVKANHVEKTDHPCQFPIALARRLILALSPKQGTVVDPYSGAATTAVASLIEGRNYIGSDIEAAYLALATERLTELVNGSLQVRQDVPVFAPSGRESVSMMPPHFGVLKPGGEI